ncbi:hypothetical protein [Kribbella sp. CA-294648]|jgi:hypothetical protein|uniref:hypothetical protein n=1 Tax=Kribbella sp. CA-294648 TaxID=3239948 RepID=UPI003D8E05C3
MADLRNKRKKVPGGRTGAPVRQGHALRRVRLACGQVQRDRIARAGDRVWCEGDCSDWVQVVSVEE